MSDKNEEKLKRLLSLMDEDSLTKEDFTAAFDMVLTHMRSFEDTTVADIAKIFDLLDGVSKQLKTDNEDDRATVKQIVGEAIAELRVKMDSRIAEKELALDKRIADIKDGKDADEQMIIQTVLSHIPTPKNGNDGSPDTPDEVIEKINKSSLTIATERVAGLVDYIRMAAQNAASSMPVTTAFYNGLRGKNLTIVGGTAKQVGDTVQITVSGAGGGQVNSVVAGSNITVDSTDPANPIVSATGGGSGITRSINSISTPTSAGATAATDYVYLVSGTTTLTLPTAVGNTNRYTVKNVGSNTVTIDTTSAQTIDGSATASLPVQYTALDLISDNSSWNVI